MSMGISFQSLLDDRLLRRRVLVALLLAELALLAISIAGSGIHIDEAWIGEQAFYLSRDGYVHSELFDGFAGNGDRIIVYHRLFVLAGSWMVAVFGWSIWSLRAVPLLCGVALMSLMWLYVRRVRKQSIEQCLLALCLFLLVPLDFQYIKVYRPEMMAVLFGFASMYALHSVDSATDRGRAGRMQRSAVAGACASLAMLAHPYGLAYVLAGGVALMLERNWKLASVFAIAALLPLLPAAYDIATHWQMFLEQLTNPLVAEKTHFTFMSPALNLLREHQRLFRNSRTIPISALFVFAIVAHFLRRDRTRDATIVHTLFLVLFVGALVQDKSDRPGMLFYPFFGVVISGLVRELVARGRMHYALRAVGAMLLALYCGFGLYYQASSAFAAKDDVPLLNAAIARAIPPGSTVAVPMNFVFNEIDNYDLAATKLATIGCDGKLDANCLVAFMRKRGASHVVFSRFGFDAEEKLRDSAQQAALSDLMVSVESTDDFQIWRME